MMPTLARTALAWVTTSYPAIRTWPDVGISVVVRIEIVVVLPAPLGPRKAKNSPLRTVKLMPSTAFVLPFRYRLTRPSTSTMAAPFADPTLSLSSPTERRPGNTGGCCTASRSADVRRADPVDPHRETVDGLPANWAGRCNVGTAPEDGGLPCMSYRTDQ